MKFFLSKRINTRLLFGFAVTPAIMIILNIIGISQVNSISTSLTNINDVNSVKQRFAINFRGSVHDRAISLRDVVLYKDTNDIQKSVDEIATLAAFYQESAVQLDRIIQNESESFRGEDHQLLSTIKDIEKSTLPLIEKVIQVKTDGDEAAAWKLLMEQAKPSFTAWLASINKFIDYQEKLNSEAADKARSTASGFQFLMSILTLICLVISAVLGFAIAGSIVKQLRIVASEIDQSSLFITGVSQTISESSQSLADGSRNQSQSIESISSSMEEINAMVHKTAANSRHAAEVAETSKQSAQTGETVVMQMISAIDAIDTSTKNIMVQVDESNRKISEIVSMITEINDKTKVINDIVFQTKLLSFNASVEAARAGESGKGFAVVAEEVGNLAQMSGNSAKEITALLNTSKTKVESIVYETKTKVKKLIEEAGLKVEAGNKIARQCSEVLREIAGKVNDVTQMAKEISTSTTEQSNGLTLITSNITSMDEVTQKNSQLSGSIAQTSSTLNKQAQELRRAFSHLNELIQSNAGDRVSVQPKKISQTEDPSDDDDLDHDNVLDFKRPA